MTSTRSSVWSIGRAVAEKAMPEVIASGVQVIWMPPGCFNEEEVRHILELARRNDEQEIRQLMLKVFVKKVEYILRCGCG